MFYADNVKSETPLSFPHARAIYSSALSVTSTARSNIRKKIKYVIKLALKCQLLSSRRRSEDGCFFRNLTDEGLRIINSSFCFADLFAKTAVMPVELLLSICQMKGSGGSCSSSRYVDHSLLHGRERNLLHPEREKRF